MGRVIDEHEGSGVAMAFAGKIGLKAISVVIGIPVGIASKKAVEHAWLAARPQDPPRKPSEPDVRWTDALGWAALSAAGIVLAELITQAGARATFKAITGNEPPPAKKVKEKVD